MELLATARAKARGRMCCLSGGTDTRLSCTAFRKFSAGWHVIHHTTKWSARPPRGHSRNAPARPGCSGGRGPLAAQGGRRVPTGRACSEPVSGRLPRARQRPATSLWPPRFAGQEALLQLSALGTQGARATTAGVPRPCTCLQQCGQLLMALLVLQLCLTSLPL